MTRRDFLIKSVIGGASLFAGASFISQTMSCDQTEKIPQPSNKNRKIIFSTHTRRIGVINEDGSGLSFLTFDIPDQESWGSGPVFPDGKRILVTSYEKGKVWEGRVLTHIWIYHLEDKTLTEIATKNRPADSHIPALIMPDGERIVTGAIIDGEQRIFSMNLDGSDQVEITKQGEGYTYGVSLSPEGKKLAFHVTNTMPYSIFSIGVDGSNRTLVATHPDHLYFGTSWSPDGEWILYQDCHYKTNPGHDWSNLCISRPDGSEHRVITEDLRHWFGTSYGTPETRGGGSNMPQYSPDGSVVTYTRAKLGSRTAWQWVTDRPDTDHFNRDYVPDKARGGTDICLLDPLTKELTSITDNEPLVWDFRTTWTPEGDKIIFCRAKIGEPSELWIMDADGKNQRFLTRGEDDKGADHPRLL